jgi:hypothetical protein
MRQKNTITFHVQAKILSVYNWPFPTLGPAVVSVGTGTGNSQMCVSLQLRRPTKKSQSNVTHEAVYFLCLNLATYIWSYFIFTLSQSQTYPFWLWVDGGGLFYFNMP